MTIQMKKFAKPALFALTLAALLLAAPALAPAYAQAQAQTPGPHADHGPGHNVAKTMEPDAVKGSSCFRTADIKNHTVAEDGSIYLKVRINDVYRVTTTNRCARPFDRTNPLVIKTPASTGFVCKAIDLDLGINRNGFTSPCMINEITKLTPAEAAALPKDVRP